MSLWTEESLEKFKKINDRFFQLNDDALKARKPEIDMLEEMITGMQKLLQHIKMQAMAEAWKKLEGEIK